MCIITAQLPVVTLDDFDADNSGFILLPLEGLNVRFSFLEQRHRLSCYAIIYSRQGGGSVDIDSNSRSMKDESVLCIGSNSVLRMQIGERAEGWMILFSATFFSLRYNENLLHHFACLKTPGGYQKFLEPAEAEEWAFSMSRIGREFFGERQNKLPVLRSHLNILLSELNRSVPTPLRIPTAASEKRRKILEFEALIEQQFQAQRLPSYYARSLFISVNYLNRISKELRGISAGELIRDRVGMEAERLLLHTSKTVSEISDLLGFEKHSYFTTFFKRLKGVTPDLFRKQHKLM